jgi:hypothetical protein
MVCNKTGIKWKTLSVKEKLKSYSESCSNGTIIKERVEKLSLRLNIELSKKIKRDWN